MSLWSLLGYALRQSPLVVAGKAARVGRRKVLALVNQGIRSHRSPYPPLRKAPPRGPSLLDAPFRIQVPEAVQAVLLARCREILGHRFDLLGSGWLDAGYPDAPGRERLIARLPPGARAQAAALWALVDPSYRPIDWHADVKSGVRWPEGRWKDGIRYGHMKGVDVKVPWELARLQHLPMLAAALSFAGPELAERMRREIRNQALDFLAANPTGFGVNWVCTMDVAIRAANLCLALDMVRATGGGGDEAFDPPFLEWMEAGLMAHGRFIVQNLEWSPDRRGNHYLADLAGLLFVAAWAPPSPETDGWVKLAGDGLVTEIPLQFDGDGANFEASTCYHRLSAEMALYCAALLLGLPEPPALPEPVVARLSRMARFTRDVTKPDGRVVQIGDNDSGRFFKPFPAASPAAPLDEDSLDHRALAGLASALFDDADLTRFAGDGGAAERALAESLSRGRRLPPPLSPLPAPDRVVRTGGAVPGPCSWSRRVVILPPDPAVLADLVFAAYPDFGLYIWKNRRFFLSVRCGPIGQNGYGGHAHNDQLSIELQIEGVDWARDPGTGVYTADLDLRDRYRSTAAHCTPQPLPMEQGRLNLGPFRLGDQARARCFRADGDGFHGVHWGFGPPIYRVVSFTETAVIVRDGLGAEAPSPLPDQETVRVASAADMARLTPDNGLPFSPGYGRMGGG